MRCRINSPQLRYALGVKMGLFLIAQGRGNQGRWTGRLTEAEQAKALGVEIGPGTICLDGKKEKITLLQDRGLGLEEPSVVISLRVGNVWTYGHRPRLINQLMLTTL